MPALDTVQLSRQMRKGTRACQECRRRKIKCTYANDIIATCHECSENKRLCDQQARSISRSSAPRVTKSNPTRLKVRVTRLESVVERLAKVLPQDHSNEAIQSESYKEDLENRNTSTGFEERRESSLPIYALFRNEVLSTTDNLSLPPAVDHSVVFNQSYTSTRELLLSTIAKEKDLMTVLDLSNEWWPPFHKHYSSSQIPSLHFHDSLLEFVVHNLASENPVHISTALVAIATSLQTLRPGVDDKTIYLSASCTEVMNRILAAVDQFVLNTEKQHDSKTVEFSEVVLLLLRGKLHAESNQLRKAWLGIRNALLLSQKIAHGSEEMRGFLDGLLETNRFFSMFLGLPYATDADFEGSARSGGEFAGLSDLTTKMRSLRRVAAIAAGEINDRNARPEDMALAKTIATQHRLDMAVKTLPPEFWDIDTLAEILGSPAILFEHLTAQFWLFQTQIFLQLPYMFHPGSSLDATGSQALCLRACRALLGIWIYLRQSKDMQPYLCRLDDFQALIASIILQVGVLLQGLDYGEESYQQSMQALEDVKRIFRGLESEQNGSIARQGLRVLETLEEFIDPADSIDSEAGGMRGVTIFVPYLGAITVQAGQRLSAVQQPTNSSVGTFDSSGYFSYLQASPGETVDSLESRGFLEDATFGIGQRGVNEKTDDLALDLFDWDSFMMGTELNQEWNEQLFLRT